MTEKDWAALREMITSVAAVIVGLVIYVGFVEPYLDRPHDLKVCIYQQAMYSNVSEHCRDLLADDAVRQSEAEERKKPR